MSVTSTLSPDGNVLTIAVRGRFDFKSHNAFRKAYEQGTKGDTEFIVDMADAEYMDSSALGMLLMLREYAGGDSDRVRIVNATGEIRNILRISNFQKLFNIE